MELVLHLVLFLLSSRNFGDHFGMTDRKGWPANGSPWEQALHDWKTPDSNLGFPFSLNSDGKRKASVHIHGPAKGESLGLIF